MDALLATIQIIAIAVRIETYKIGTSLIFALQWFFDIVD
jgi:hypothetical protein